MKHTILYILVALIAVSPASADVKEEANADVKEEANADVKEEASADVKEEASADVKRKARAVMVADDLIGTWEMYYQMVRPMQRDDAPLPTGSQYFEFSESGQVKNVISLKPLTPEEIKVRMKKEPGGTRYTIEGGGIVNVIRSSEDRDNIMISVVRKDLDEPMSEGTPLLKKGDLVLTYRDSLKRPYMRRYFRKVTIP